MGFPSMLLLAVDKLRPGLFHIDYVMEASMQPCYVLSVGSREFTRSRTYEGPKGSPGLDLHLDSGSNP